MIVTGKSYGTNSQFDFYTIKYNSFGTVQWGGGIRYNGGGNRDDVPTGLAVDSNDDIIVTGSSYLTTAQTSYYTVKYTSAGAAAWARTYTSPSDAQATAVAVDLHDNVIVTGIGRNADDTRFFHTIAYNSAGTFQWAQDHNSIDSDYVGGAADVAVDHSGNVIVTGTTVGASPFDNKSYYTAKYSHTGSIFAGLLLLGGHLQQPRWQ